MSGEGILDKEVAVPNLKLSVPSNSCEVRKLLGWGVSDLRDPVSVVVLVTCPLALATDVPEFDGFTTATGEDDSVVWGESA